MFNATNEYFARKLDLLIMNTKHRKLTRIDLFKAAALGALQGLVNAALIIGATHIAGAFVYLTLKTIGFIFRKK